MLASRRTALVVYGLAMGYLEGAVVVYLRALYYPSGFNFPLVQMDPFILGTEVGREAATLVMIFAAAWAACRSTWQLVTGFALVFGIWDLVYYATLKLLLAWPASVTTPDVLFLIPWTWVGPVWAPAGIAASMSLAAWFLWPRPWDAIRGRTWEWSLLIAAGLILLATFLVPPLLSGAGRLDRSGIRLPEYPWWGWVLGEALAVFVALRWWRRGRMRFEPAAHPS